MKRLILTTICALAMTGAAFAQGTLNWGSIPFGSMTAQTNTVTYSGLFGGGATGIAGATQGVTALTADGFYYELLYSPYVGFQSAIPSTLPGLLAWSDSFLQATNNTAGTAGRLVPVAGNASASVAGWANGTTNDIMLVGWSANLGTTWGAVSNLLNNWSTLGSTVVGRAFFGESATGYINPNLAPAGGATLFNSVATVNGLPINSVNTQLYLLPVPEPATMALAGLGGLSMLLFRRQRK